MNFNDTVKTVFIHFLVIIACILLITGIINLVDGMESFSYFYPFSTIIIAFSMSLPTFLFYSKNELSKKEYNLRLIIHAFLLVVILFSFGFLFHWYEEIIDGIMLMITFIIIYTIVRFVTYLLAKNEAKKINEKLSSKQHNN